MSNVNNYKFANMLELFKKKMVDTQAKKVEEAQKIMDDPTYKWDNAEQKAAGEAKLKNYKDWLQFYQEFYDQGVELTKQHEGLVNTMSKVYDKWWNDISNEGKQETEIMSCQADMMNEMFGEIYKELKPLNLDGMKPPQAMNL